MREITRKGELTRAEVEALLVQHVGDGLVALAEAGVTVSLIAMPTKDPADGKAVIGCNTGETFDAATLFETAARKLRLGHAFKLKEGDG